MPEHRHCRVCRTPLGAPFLDFGDFPLANSFLDAREPVGEEPKFPLAVCSCPDCGFMQLDFVVPAEILYRDYIYVSSTSEAVARHAADLAERLGGAGKFVVEIASNDGTVLKPFRAGGARVLGIEPALNIARMAEAAGIPTVPEFFDAQTAAAVAAEHGRADVMLARHVFAHVDDIADFLTGVRTLLAPAGTMWIEVPYVGELLEHNEFDTIYHEHLSYVAVEPIARLCADLDLRVVDVQPVALHGGSILIGIKHDATGGPAHERLEAFVARERAQGYCDPARHARFAEDVRRWRQTFVSFVDDLCTDGAKLVGYGAAAKANTLLCWCPEVAERLEVIFDKSPLKAHKYTPGTHIEVRPPDDWPQFEATHMVILAWNFAEEIRRQMHAFEQGGGKFVVPIPAPKVLG